MSSIRVPAPPSRAAAASSHISSTQHLLPKPPVSEPLTARGSSSQCADGSIIASTRGSSGSRKTGAASSRRSGTAAQTSSSASTVLTDALSRVHSLLRSESSVLRKVFRAIDPDRVGSAQRSVLQAQIVAHVRLSDADVPGLERILDVADPQKNGVIEFGRLMRLVRSARAPDNSFVVVDDEEAELRRCFSGVNTGDKLLFQRISENRALPRMPTGARTSNILGDSHLRAPWAIGGDDARMSHILASMQSERNADLRAALNSVASRAANGEARLGAGQLLEGLRIFDPFVHEKEALEYFRAMTAGRSERATLALEETTATGGELVLSARLRRATIGVEDFLRRFGHTVMTAPAIRCSATFSVKWRLPPPLPPKPVG